LYWRNGQKLTKRLETESAYLEVSQILALERCGGGICEARTGAEDPQENSFAVSENLENEKGQAIGPAYHVSDLTLLNVVESV
jgi:hypothetical protein